MALHIACGDITEVEIKDGRLKLVATDNTMLSLLEEGKREIERALSWQGLDLVVDIQERKKEPSKVEQDLKKLNKLFGEKVKIKK